LHVPRPDIEQVQESSGDCHSSTYISRGAVREKYGVVDLHIGIGVSKDGSALEVACSPPGHGRNFRKVLENVTHALTTLAVLLLNVLS
jgi:hypothetical protein